MRWYEHGREYEALAEGVWLRGDVVT
jgi:hypothetical protein